MNFSSLRQSLRSLAAHRAFTFAAIATLALGIGANAAIFSVVNGLLLKPLPYPDGERLVEVYNSYPKMLDYAGSSIPDYLDRKKAAGLEDLALYTRGSFNIADEAGPERLVGVRATPSLFTTLRVQPVLGRAFTEDEAKVGADKVVVLSHQAWVAHFSSDPAIVGREVRLNNEPYRVIGVMAQGFAFPDRRTTLWVPFAFTPDQMSDNERGNEYSAAIGRMKPGVTEADLNAQFQAIVMANADRIATAGAEGAEAAAFYRGGGFTGKAKSLREQWVGTMKPVLQLLQLVVIVVLLIACANVANLFLTRLSARRRELSVRAALGADRWRLARQLLGEALLLAFAGGIAGILLAYFSLGSLHMLGLDQTLLGERIDIDATVLLFTFGIAMLTGVLFGTVPALSQDGARASEVLRESGRSGGSRVAQRIRGVLVVVQIALAVCLLVGAGLLLRSFEQVQKQDPGFDSKGVVTVQLDLPASRYQGSEPQVAFYDRLRQELRAIPGTRAVGFTSQLPFNNANSTASYGIVGREEVPGEPGPHGYLHVADGDYFKAMGIPLRSGRLFDERDRAGSAPVVIIDEYLANKYFPAGDAVGQRLKMGGPDGTDEVESEIIGIVATVKRGQLNEETKKETYFLPLSQYGSRSAMAVLKTELDAASALAPIRAAVQGIDPLQPVYDLKSLDARIVLSLEGRMAPLILLAVFAGVALLLAAVGIYGVLAFSVEQRTSEIGVRLALGAGPGQVQRLVLLQGMQLAGIGLALGTIAAVLGGRVLESQLFGVTSDDPLTLLLVLGLLGSTAMLACYLPARRATRVAPMVALRNE